MDELRRADIGARRSSPAAHRDLFLAGSRRRLGFLRANSPGSMTAPQRLLASLGTDRQDRDILARVAAENASAEARSVAARSLTSDASRVETLLAAASAHQDVFDAACDAVIRHGASRQRVLRLIDIAPRGDASVGRLAGVLVAMPPDQRLATLRAVSDAQTRAALLAAVVARPELAEDPSLLAMHARSRLVSLDGAGALDAALAALRVDETGASEAATVRFHALVMLNRLDEASATRESESLRLWLDALERCVAVGRAPAIASSRPLRRRDARIGPERFGRLVAGFQARRTVRRTTRRPRDRKAPDAILTPRRPTTSGFPQALAPSGAYPSCQVVWSALPEQRPRRFPASRAGNLLQKV